MTVGSCGDGVSDTSSTVASVWVHQSRTPVYGSHSSGSGCTHVESKRTPYFSLLPPEAQPAIDLNKAEMEKFRPQMRKFYLDKTPRFD